MSRAEQAGAQEKLPLTHNRIVTKALEIADADGLDALSMRRLAGALGVKAMSLYNHVDSRDAIIDGIVDLVVSEIDLPSIDLPWKEAMRARAHSAHAALLRHRWATFALVSRVNAGDAMMRYVDTTLACLVEAGFPVETADHAWNAMDNHIYGFTLQEITFPFPTSEYADAAREFMDRIDTSRFPYLHSLATLVMTGRHTGISDFSFGLELILDGLERILNQIRSTQ